MKHNPNPPRRHADALRERMQQTREKKAEEARKAAEELAARDPEGSDPCKPSDC